MNIGQVLNGKTDFVVWPAFGSGNAMVRIVTAHDAYVYNPDWNHWGPLETPLTPPPVYMDGQGFSAHIDNFCITDLRRRVKVNVENKEQFAFALPTIIDELNDGSFELILKEHKEHLTDSEKQFLKNILQKGKRQAVGGYHIPATRMLEITDQPVVQLYFEDYNILMNRVQLHSMKITREILTKQREEEYYRLVGHHASKIINHPQVVNISIERFFYSDFDSFMLEYEKLKNFLKLEDRHEQVWAFVLYYKDAITRMVDFKKEDHGVATERINIRRHKRYFKSERHEK